MDERVKLTAADLEQSAKAFDDLPASSTCRLIGFDSANAYPGIVNGTWFLHVRGEKPWSNMTVTLVPAIYITTPDYWQVEVVGCLYGIGFPAMTPYDVTGGEFSRGYGIGHKGIEVVGAGKTQIITIP